jgi:methylated-DNA-[protein]-cysteine S-methyltransferase
MRLVTPPVVEFASLTAPVGPLLVAVHDAAVCALFFTDEEERLRHAVERRFPTASWKAAADPAGVVTALHRYFAGELNALATLTVNAGGTPFQASVWRTLRTIPPGCTVSYRELAGRIGRPTAVRAVGAANGANPVSLIVPCHRVIGADGRLVGYGGGLHRKQWLLEHEGVRRSFNFALARDGRDVISSAARA